MTEKRVALVTGGARGIGLGIALKLAGEGLDLAICDVSPEESAEENMASLRAAGAEMLYCQADVSDADARASMLVSIEQRFGRLDVLINNAGVAPLQRLDVLETTEESYERVMKINLQGPFFLTQAVANWMIRQKESRDDFKGSIVQVSSISSTVASPNRGEYCISKAGVSMATMLWAVRLGEFGIPVYEIRPGVIKTDMTAAVTEKYDKLISEGLCLQPRWGTPEDIGRAVAMLVRGDCLYSTGQVIMVDGGMTIQTL